MLFFSDDRPLKNSDGQARASVFPIFAQQIVTEIL